MAEEAKVRKLVPSTREANHGLNAHHRLSKASNHVNYVDYVRYVEEATETLYNIIRRE